MSIDAFPSLKSLKQSRSLIALLLLIVAGYLGNYWRLSFFFSVDFLFGSIAVWIVVCLYGTTCGTATALIASLCTYFIWHHPYSMITFTCEALFVGLLFHRQRRNIVMLDGLFWILVGMPLVWFFYGQILQVGSVQVTIVVLKQAVNGIFNALIASLMLTHLPIHRWVHRPQTISTLSLQQTLLNLLVAFVFFPTLILMVLDSRQVVNNMRTSSINELDIASANLQIEFQTWYDQHCQAVTKLAELAALKPLKAPVLEESLELIQDVLPDFRSLSVVDAAGATLFTTASTLSSAIAPFLLSLDLDPWRSGIGPQVSNLIVSSQAPTDSVFLLTAPILDASQPGWIVAEIIPHRNLSQLIQAHSRKQKLQITLVDGQQTILARTESNPTIASKFERRQNGEVLRLDERTYHWLPRTGRTAMMRWSQSFFVQEIQIVPQLPWALIIELPAEAQVHDIEQAHTKNLLILILIAGASLGFATLLSRQLVNPLAKLAVVTTNLPNKLLDREFIAWPYTTVTELDSLVHNFHLMAASLMQKFAELNQANEMLEQRVQERTQQLSAINAELAAEISERRKTEEKLKAYTVRLEQSNRELQDFASVASHDLQEPLRKIQAFGDRLKLKCADALPPEGQDYLGRMQNAAHRMQVLINDLLAFSRVTTKAQPFVLVPLTTIVHEVLSDVEVHVQQVKAHIEVGPLPTLDADPLQMRQLFQNLISNALKFHRADVTPRIQILSQPCDSEETALSVSLSGEPTAYQIRVVDNGIGFDEKYLDRIFTVFQRLHNRNQYEGTGVGLAICRKIVERHNGQITATSQPGHGTTFIITLPTHQHP